MNETEPVSIKVKKVHTLPRFRDALNLNKQKTGQSPKRSRAILFLLIMVFAQAGLVVWLINKNPASPYAALAPDKAAAVIYLDRDQLKTLMDNPDNQTWLPFQILNNEAKRLIDANNLSAAAPLLGALDNQSALILSPSTTDDSSSSVPDWLFLAKSRAGVDLNSLLAQAQNQIKNTFDLTSSAYRQINITQAQSFGADRRRIFFATAKGFIFLANREETLKAAIDKLLD